ncbi:MAG: 1-deoxy-D-xylulose-5-phosphate synthase [Candidatus Accumulibacter sp.]|jgi:1-deoxy-D-xylulose-5-phosphate synthase|nr:1-deoxy-D-xylulose-5-phosphate synthase [Accumulibacter sp.]
MSYPLLDLIDDPARLRELDRRQLCQLAEELRAFLVESVSHTGGHLSSNLGTVELTIALHYVFDTPNDRLVWDVGHQTYTHKILTGRRAGMARLRTHGGVSGFPRRSESPFDIFGVGHSSTSISAALGMALAAKLKGDTRHTVAVIGDGAMSAGQAFEALNNAGVADADMLVILNDNDMSISPPVGALNKYLARALSGSTFNAARRAGEKVFGASSSLIQFASRVEEHVKGLLTPGTLFEELGFNYIGPIDGHDLDSLIPTLQNLQKLKGPQFLHVVTCKGQGYKLAEADPVLYHGVSKFEPEIGVENEKDDGKPTYAQVFGQWLCDMAAVEPELVAITPAMTEGSGMVEFAERFPDRHFDVGIAEQHAVTFAAGLACEGMRPVVAIYSTFLQRGFDQLLHDVALQNLPVVFALDRGGLVGADGPTHHGAFDLSYLSCVPNMTIMAPADEEECRRMLTTAFRLGRPCAVRYPRGTGPGVKTQSTLESIPFGRGEWRRHGRNVALLAFGSMLTPALQAAEKIDASVVNMRFVKPVDREMIVELAREHSLLVSIEENALIGGAGAEVARVLEETGSATRFVRMGLPDRFIEHGDQTRLLAEVGLDEAGILHTVHQAQSHRNES